MTHIYLGYSENQAGENFTYYKGSFMNLALTYLDGHATAILGMHLFIIEVCTAGLGDLDLTGTVEAGGGGGGRRPL